MKFEEKDEGDQFNSFTLENEIDPENYLNGQDQFKLLGFSFYNSHRKDADSAKKLI